MTTEVIISLRDGVSGGSLPWPLSIGCGPHVAQFNEYSQRRSSPGTDAPGDEPAN